MHFLQRRKILKATSLLELIPVPLVGYERNDSNKVELLVPKFKNENFARWFIPKRRSIHYRIKLDETGSKVWLEMDGESTVDSIAERLSLDLDSDRNERLGKYFTMLYDAGYITFKQLLQPQKSTI